MKCQECGCEIKDDSCFNFEGRNLCEDCYMDARIAATPRQKVCDPMAVQLTRGIRKTLGQEGSEGLLKIQQDIYQFIKLKGEVETSELLKKFKLTPQELEQHIATLRHCELVKGKKINEKIYFILFS